MSEAEPEEKQARRLTRNDSIFRGLTKGAAISTVGLCLGMALTLLTGSLPALNEFGIDFFKAGWDPANNIFGAAGPILGTLQTSLIAMAVAVPLAIGASYFQTEMCPQRWRRAAAIGVDTLAGIPSVVYGLLGLTYVVPFLTNYAAPFLASTIGLSNVPLLSALFAGPVTGGGSILAAGLVLGLMILPTIAAQSREASSLVPESLRKAARAMGLTRWETYKKVIMPNSRIGQIGAGMLGLARALGETMAVTFLIGNVHKISASLLAGGASLTTTIVNAINEVATNPAYRSAVIGLGLVLWGISAATSYAGNRLNNWMERRREQLMKGERGSSVKPSLISSPLRRLVLSAAPEPRIQYTAMNAPGPDNAAAESAPKPDSTGGIDPHHPASPANNIFSPPKAKTRMPTRPASANLRAWQRPGLF